MRENRILGIDPGTKHLGMAVLEGGRLLYHGVANLDPKQTPSRRLLDARDLVSRLLDDFKPQVLAIERTFIGNNRNAALLNVLADECRAQARRRMISVLGFAPSTVKKHMTGDGRADKRAVAQAVVKRFPELKAYLREDSKWKERYLSNMFDAVAVALSASDSSLQDS